MMSVRLFSTLDELTAISQPWSDLAAGVPMRGHEWLAGWWRHYQATSGELCIPTVWRDDQLVGLAPWRIEQSLRTGKVIRWIGDGEVCTDHLGILSRDDALEDVVASLANWLSDEYQEWDLVDLDHVDQTDRATTGLFTALAERDCKTTSTPDDACWTIDLPSDWEEFLARQSKSHRKQLRRAERRVLDADNCRWTPVCTRDDWEQAWPILVDLHQRRRQSLGEPGCFASQRFTEFHRELSLTLLANDQLRMSWVELNGTPAAVEYHFARPGAVYAYQGGVDPDRLDDEPGRLSNIATLKHAIEEGRSTFDFLRGDEPYKAHWRAEPQPTLRCRATAPRASAQLRDNANRAAEKMRGAFKQGLKSLRG